MSIVMCIRVVALERLEETHGGLQITKISLMLTKYREVIAGQRSADGFPYSMKRKVTIVALDGKITSSIKVRYRKLPAVANCAGTLGARPLQG